MTNQLDRDRELLKEWKKFEDGNYHKTVFWNDGDPQQFVVQNLLMAQDRISRMEEREKILGIIGKSDCANHKIQPFKDLLVVDNQELKDGKWQKAIEEPYKPNWLEKMICLMGIHHDPFYPFKDQHCYICNKKLN